MWEIEPIACKTSHKGRVILERKHTTRPYPLQAHGRERAPLSEQREHTHQAGRLFGFLATLVESKWRAHVSRTRLVPPLSPHLPVAHIFAICTDAVVGLSNHR